MTTVHNVDRYQRSVTSCHKVSGEMMSGHFKRPSLGLLSDVWTINMACRRRTPPICPDGVTAIRRNEPKYVRMAKRHLARYSGVLLGARDIYPDRRIRSVGRYFEILYFYRNPLVRRAIEPDRRDQKHPGAVERAVCLCKYSSIHK